MRITAFIQKAPPLEAPRRLDHLADSVNHQFGLIELNRVTALLRDRLPAFPVCAQVTHGLLLRLAASARCAG